MIQSCNLFFHQCSSLAKELEKNPRRRGLAGDVSVMWSGMLSLYGGAARWTKDYRHVGASSCQHRYVVIIVL